MQKSTVPTTKASRAVVRRFDGFATIATASRTVRHDPTVGWLGVLTAPGSGVHGDDDAMRHGDREIGTIDAHRPLRARTRARVSAASMPSAQPMPWSGHTTRAAPLGLPQMGRSTTLPWLLDASMIMPPPV